MLKILFIFLTAGIGIIGTLIDCKGAKGKGFFNKFNKWGWLLFGLLVITIPINIQIDKEDNRAKEIAINEERNARVRAEKQMKYLNNQLQQVYATIDAEKTIRNISVFMRLNQQPKSEWSLVVYLRNQNYDSYRLVIPIEKTVEPKVNKVQKKQLIIPGAFLEEKKISSNLTSINLGSGTYMIYLKNQDINEPERLFKIFGDLQRITYYISVPSEEYKKNKNIFQEILQSIENITLLFNKIPIHTFRAKDAGVNILGEKGLITMEVSNPKFVKSEHTQCMFFMLKPQKFEEFYKSLYSSP